jgi:hypothetical protein
MLARIATVIAQLPPLPSPGEGSHSFQRMMALFGILMGAGFILGIAGHITKSRTLVAVGVLLVFAATGLFLVAVAQHG